MIGQRALIGVGGPSPRLTHDLPPTRSGRGLRILYAAVELVQRTSSRKEGVERWLILRTCVRGPGKVTFSNVTDWLAYNLLGVADRSTIKAPVERAGTALHQSAV